ncbi:MAG: phenylalanine 4-monooxygenase, partial [Lautropia sp.]|nr:phenylalanine 4-monooxygenase [Lautropia sp.]
HGLRGHYENVGPDFTVPQEYQRYTDAHHDVWRRLYARQSELIEGRACEPFVRSVEALARTGFANAIPRFDDVNRALAGTTGWQVVPVPGLLPDQVFFQHLANRRFPVTVWIREPEEFDYIAEPDLFHDFFGHVPLLFDQKIADYLQAYGAGGLKALHLDALANLARLYWYTIEFGMTQEGGQLRAYGAGILSSPGELRFVTDCAGRDDRHHARFIRFDLLRVMQTQYLIDDFQQTYFVIDSFDRLIEATAPDFTPYYRSLRDRPVLSADAIVPQDRPIDPAPAN